MMHIRASGVVIAAILLLGWCVPEVAAQAAIQINYHPGWLASATQTGFDVAEGWPVGDECCWERNHPIEGTCTFGVNNPDVTEGDSDFWNPPSYPVDPSYLWILNEGATLQSKCTVDVTKTMPWLFVQFFNSDMNDGVAEIAVSKDGYDWLTVGSYDTFGRGHNWVSIEGLPQGSYYVRIISRRTGRTIPPPNASCNPANNLQPARIGSTAPMPLERISVTGGGWIPIQGGKATFGLNIVFTGGNDRPTGTFTYVDNVFKASIRSTEILGIEVEGDEAWVRFAGLSNAGTNHTVGARVREGGAGASSVTIRVWTECTSGWIYGQQATLGGGQIKIR